MHEHIETALNDSVRPLLRNHGGDVELVSVEEETGIVAVRLQGACTQCPSARLTLHFGVERILKEAVPGVKQVLQAPPPEEPPHEPPRETSGDASEDARPEAPAE